MNTTPPPITPLRVVARRLHVSVKSLREEAEAGRIPAIRVGDGKDFVCDPEAVEAALLARVRNAVTLPKEKEATGAR